MLIFCGVIIVGLFADVGEQTAINIQDVAVDGIGSM